MPIFKKVLLQFFHITTFNKMTLYGVTISKMAPSRAIIKMLCYNAAWNAITVSILMLSVIVLCDAMLIMINQLLVSAPSALCNKTFYGCNLQMFIIS